MMTNTPEGIKEHNETLREKWEVYALSTIADHDELNTNDVFKWFLAQFDAMLAEDIDKIKSQTRLRCFKCNGAHTLQHALGCIVKSEALSIIEARRLSLKK